ncbi:MAG: hypothetical protein WCP45_00780 [Verrucomicrobiota bacterium]
MKRAFTPIPWLALTIAWGIALACPARAQTATQIVTLSAGWNSVWLEVEPMGTDGNKRAPQEVFNNAAIQVIATPKPLAGSAEFFGAAPGTIGTFNQDEWQQWKRTDPAGSNNLPLVSGNRPYLLQVATGTPQFALTLSGKANFFRPTWTPDRYNLVGFGLDGAAPSFNAFFSPSGAKHLVTKIFRLNPNGNWEHVAAGDSMVSDRAYWVFSAGPSMFMGPVAVDFDHAITGVLNFGGPADAVPVGTGVDALELDLEELVFTNLGAAAASPGLDLISTRPGQGSLALHVVKPTATSLAYTRIGQVDSAPGAGAGATLGETVAPQASATLTLGAQRNWTLAPAERTNLYRLKTGAAGASFWLPVTARNTDVAVPTDPTAPSAPLTVTGLWVGEVTVNAATSIVEDGAPVRPAAGAAPMRILLHSDVGGAVRLLSQVTLMQTKTADPAVVPVPVLVVDPARIPFFEGIKERNGKRIGVRLEAVAYDMPRDSAAVAQSSGSGDLIDMIVAESSSPVTKWASGKNRYLTRAAVDQTAIDSYLLFRSLRPPPLKEVYKMSLPVGGGLGAGKTVATTAGTPLVLDPFHRSNPFRHPYHHNLPKGPNITRRFTIVFDPDQPLTDRLRGTYQETIQGLISSDLTLSGRVEFRRVSPVATLEGS